ncbi:winged helix-turn-helix transcriptional regulator [Parasedimentitalea maritima]|nr:helix-turn-helix domain-containing protein [Zongyanglinia marina]
MAAKGGTNSLDRHTEVTKVDIDEMNDGVDSWIANEFSGVCPVRDLLDRIGDKWSVMVVLRLGRGTERFRALLRAVDGISQRMLTVTLRALESDGLVHREVFDTRPPSVAYSLTPLGVSLLVHISALANWAMEHEAEVKEAQAAFSAKTAKAAGEH